MLCCHCEGDYTAPTPMSSVYQTCCQRQLIGRLSLYDADCELTCHARSSKSSGALSLARFHAPRLHWYRSPQCDPKAYGLDILRRLLRKGSVHFVCTGTGPPPWPEVLWKTALLPGTTPALNPAARGTSLHSGQTGIDGGLRSYDAAGGDRMTPA